MKIVKYLPDAKKDFDDSFNWYAKRSHRAAMDFDASINDALERIRNHPHAFQAIDDLHREFILLRFPYRIVFRIQESDVVDVAIAHFKRRPKYWRNRDRE